MIGVMLTEMLTDMLEAIIAAIPSIIAAIIIVLIGYGVGVIVGKAVNKLISKTGMEKAFDKTVTGSAFKKAGIDFSDFIGGTIKVFIIVIAIIAAIGVLNIGGSIGEFLAAIAAYIPRLIGGVLIIIFGTVLVDLLASLIGRMMEPMFAKTNPEMPVLLKNLLMIGLIAFIITLALDTMLLSGDIIYPLILGFVIIGAGVSLTDGLVKAITDSYENFKGVAGYAKFVLYSIFLIIGTGAIFAVYPGVTEVVANVSWAFAIALAIMLIPIAFVLTKKMTKTV